MFTTSRLPNTALLAVQNLNLSQSFPRNFQNDRIIRRMKKQLQRRKLNLGTNEIKEISKDSKNKNSTNVEKKFSRILNFR